jgi:hypothetical protein
MHFIDPGTTNREEDCVGHKGASGWTGGIPFRRFAEGEVLNIRIRIHDICEVRNADGVKDH